MDSERDQKKSESQIMREQNAEFEITRSKKKAQFLRDFNEEVNCNDTIDEYQMEQLDRYERFEKSFPFYKMDVNGYMVLMQRAMRLTYKSEPDRPMWQIKHITLEAMQEAFKNNKTWTAALGQVKPPSEMIRFLNDTCRVDGSPEFKDVDKNAYSVRKLKCVGLLWCDGSNKEKVVELYDMIQDNNQSRIAADDKDFRKNLFLIFDFASTFCFKFEMIYMNTNETARTPGQDEIERVRSETYDELCEEFLDLIFEYDAVLGRDEWEKEVLAKQTYLFDPLSIRKKLGYRI